MEVMTLLHVNPVKLEYLMESLLIAFAYNELERRFTIVSDYPERSSGSSRELVALVFRDVNRFNREVGDLPELRKFRLRYSTKDEAGGRVFQNIKTADGAEGRKYVRFWFGPNMGGVAFEYRHLEVHRRGSRVVKVKKHNIYFDAVSMKEFDFFNPFPDLL